MNAMNAGGIFYGNIEACREKSEYIGYMEEGLKYGFPDLQFLQ
jgi:hypothetical protein